MNELVSIITPSYNSVRFISETIESVLDQTYIHWEMIIIDDGSSDNSIKIVESYLLKDSRIKLIKLSKNMGPATTRNYGIKEAKGRYIAFLDSDDLWYPNKLLQQISFMYNNDIALSYTRYNHIEEKSKKIINEIYIPSKVSYSELLKQNIIGCLTAIYDTKKLGKIYMPEIRQRQDYALWLDILKKIPYAYGIEESLASYRVRSTSISSNKWIASKYNWKLYREIEKLALHKAIYYFGWYTYRSILKYRLRFRGKNAK
jgi:glycosyltransferase involved in cell wall biosynthesis